MKYDFSTFSENNLVNFGLLTKNMTLTCDLWAWHFLGFVRLSRNMFMLNFIELSAAVSELSCVQRKKNSDENITVRRYRWHCSERREHLISFIFFFFWLTVPAYTKASIQL